MWLAAMTIYRTFTRECLNMKEAPEKYGGNFLGTMVRNYGPTFGFNALPLL